jgi:hypothetical protein
MFSSILNAYLRISQFIAETLKIFGVTLGFLETLNENHCLK